MASSMELALSMAVTGLRQPYRRKQIFNIGRSNLIRSRDPCSHGAQLARGKLTLGEFERLFPETSRRILQRDLKTLLTQGILKEVATGPTDPNRHLRARGAMTSCDS